MSYNIASDELMESVINAFESNDEFADRLTDLIINRINNSAWKPSRSHEYFSRRIADIVANECLSPSSSDTEN